MECDKNGRDREISETIRRGVKRKCRPGCEGGLQLAFPSAVPNAAHPLPMRVNLVPHCPPEQVSTDVKPDSPFMNNMDEISYWVYTKRAPCLFHYDNDVKRQVEQAHCSKTKQASVQSPCEEVPLPKKKKRKLKLLDDDSSSEKQQNIYFETPQNQKPAQSSCKSDIASNVDFNIKNSPQNISKRMKLQRNCQTSQKKNKLVTSTPKVTNLRRSLRKAQQNNNNSQLNNSFDLFNASIVNGKGEIEEDIKQAPEQLSAVNQIDANKSDQNKCKIPDKKKNVLNGQFEDLSDVSGFTANYIRSTKIHSSKTPKKLRNRNSRSLIKDAKNLSTEDKMVVCVNKSVNAIPDTVLNCSTDSSQNVINLVTVKDNDKSNKTNKSTSVLKFMDSKLDKTNKGDKRGKGNLNVSFQSKSSGNSRYPKRHKNNVSNVEQSCSNMNVSTTTLRYSTRQSKLNNSDRKENSEDKVTSRTRSGRKIGVKLDFAETGCSVLNNSSEQLSSSALNVASPLKRGRRPNNSSTRCLRSRRDKSGQLSKDSTSESDKKVQLQGKVKKSLDKTFRRDSLRDKSGFAACFTDSDSDSEPLKQKKFFC